MKARLLFILALFFIAPPSFAQVGGGIFNVSSANTQVNSPRVLASVSGINAKTIANTALFTVPAGATAVVTGYTVRATAAAAISAGPSAGIGNVAGTNNIISSQAMTALTSALTTFQWATTGISLATAATGTIYFNLGTGATGTSETITVDLLGYYE